MAIRVDLPKSILTDLIDNGISLRTRQIKASSNAIIRDALEQEQRLLAIAKNTLEAIPDGNKQK